MRKPVGGPIMPVHFGKVVIMRRGRCLQFIHCGACRRFLNCGACMGAVAHALSDLTPWCMPPVARQRGAAYHCVPADRCAREIAAILKSSEIARSRRLNSTVGPILLL